MKSVTLASQLRMLHFVVEVSRVKAGILASKLRTLHFAAATVLHCRSNIKLATTDGVLSPSGGTKLEF